MIVVIEPQCVGFEHANFNASFLYCVFIAFPDDEILFLGERDHIKWIQGILKGKDNNLVELVIWHEISIPPYTLRDWRRINRELDWYKNFVSIVAGKEIVGLFLCSITETALLVLKLRLYRKKHQFPIITVFHGFLSSIDVKPPSSLWKWLLRLYGILRYPGIWLVKLDKILYLPHPPQLWFLLLGRSIYNSLVEFRPQLAKYFISTDIPHIFCENILPAKSKILEKVRFGFFGTTYRGFETFNRLASEILIDSDEAEFMLVGHVHNTNDISVYDKEILGLTHKPLSTIEYNNRAKTITYVVGVRNPEHYKWGVNSTLLDSLSFIRPGIYLRNPYIEYYFKKMGNIGYLCDNYKQIKDTIQSIINDFPKAQYKKQCKNILNGRIIFEPSYVAKSIRPFIYNL